MVVEDAQGRERPLPPRHDLWNHSPDGFAWGYGGSGPAKLALALCASVLGNDETAVRVHQDVKWALVAGLPQGGPWQLTEDEIREVIERVVAERDGAA